MISQFTSDVKRNGTDAQKRKSDEFSRQQGEIYQEEIRQLHITMENLTNEIKKIKEAHIIELTEKDAISKTLKENHIIELAKKNNEIKTLKEEHIIEIKTLKDVQKSSILEDKFDAVLAKLDTIENKTEALHATVRTIPAEIITDVSKITTIQTDKIVLGMSELPDSDVIDCIVRTRIGETADVINTKTVSETAKIHEAIINIPKPIDLSPMLENIKNGLFTGFQYICKNDEGIVEPIKRHIDLLPKQATETPNLDAFSDKIMLEFDKKLERQLDLMNERFDSYDEKMELLMTKEASGQVQDTTSGQAQDKDSGKSTEHSGQHQVKDSYITSGSSSGQAQDKDSGKSTEHSGIASGTTSGKNQEKVINSLRIKKQSQKELSDGLDMNSGTVSGIVKSLINKGMVKNIEGIYEVIDGF